MVWEQGSGVLIMLTRLTEQVVKCAPYFPDAAAAQSPTVRASCSRVQALGW